MMPFATESTIGKDYVMFPVFHQMELQYSLERGSWPLYVPGFAGGRPAAALTLGQLFHPISHVAAHLPGYWSGYAFDVNTLLRFVSLAVTQIILLLLLLRWGLDTTMAFVVSLVTVYNLRMLDLFRFGASLESYTSHLILCAVLVNDFIRPTKLLGPVILVISTYLIAVSGHPQMMYYGMIASTVFGVAVPFLDAAVRGVPLESRRRILRFYLRASACMGVGILLSAAHLIPQYFDFAAETAVRLGRNYRWSLFNGDSWGGQLNSYFRPLKAAVTGAYGSSALIAVTLLIPLALLKKPRVPGVILVLWGLMALVFLIALGDATPFHRLFWDFVPLANAFRVPGRFTMLQPIILFGLLAWFFRERREVRKTEWMGLPGDWRTLLVLVALGFYLVYNLWLCEHVPYPRPPLPDRFGDVPNSAHDRLFAVGVLSLLFAGGATLGRRARPFLAAALALTALVEVGTLMRYGTWIQQRIESPSLETMDQQKRARLTFRQRPGNKMQSDLVDRRMKRSFLETDLARFYRRFRPAADLEEAFELMATSRRGDEIIVEVQTVDSVYENEPGKLEMGDDRVNLLHGSFNRVVFETENKAPGFLVYSSLDRSRWRAHVDGVETAIAMANGGEQAVYLPPGQHRVEFRFTSVAATVGMTVSLIALLGTLLFCVWRGFSGRLRIVVTPIVSLVPVFLGFWWWTSLYGGDHLGTKYTWNSRQLPAADNLAYGRRATMSSIQNPFRPYHCYAGRGVDGHRSGIGFATSRRSRGSWWQVDLGRNQPLGEIVIHDGKRSRTAKHLPMSVLVSEDGKTFKRIKKVTSRSEKPPWRMDVSGNMGRIVRLRSSRKGSFSVNEVEIYPPTKQPGAPHGVDQGRASEEE
jgi:hypothetical protein